MRKIIALFLCFVFSFLCVSCGSQKAEEIVPDYFSEIDGDIDLDGKNFVFAVVADYFFEGEDNTLSYINNTEFADLAAERLRDVSKKHNCTFEFKTVNRAGEAAYLDVASGTYSIDIIQEESYWLVSYIPMGIFVDLTTLDNMDVTNEAKWGNRNLLASTMWNGAVYGVVPAQHPLRTQNSVSGVIAINEDYVNMLNTTDPRDYFENGEWTWDTFTKVLTEYELTSLGGEKIYAFASDESRFARSVAFSNGDRYFTYNDDGTFNLGLYSPTTLDALNKFYDWLNGPTSENILIMEGLPALVDGLAVLGNVEAFEVLANTDSIAYHLNNFGVIPYPSGPDADPGWYQNYCESTDFTISIPITAPDPEATAVVLDAIYEPFEGYETSDDIIDYLHSNYFLDRRDAEFFYSLSDADHTYFFPTMDGIFGIWNSFLVSKPSEALEKEENIQYTVAEKQLVSRAKTIADVYLD